MPAAASESVASAAFPHRGDLPTVLMANGTKRPVGLAVALDRRR